MKQPPSFPDRRQFLKTGGALAAGLLTHEAQAAQNQLPALPSNPKTQASMPTRNLGKTGYKVGIFSLGGQSAIEEPNNFDVAVPLIERALDLGVNLIDTAPRYGLPCATSSRSLSAPSFRTGSSYFYAMEFVEGETLEHFIRRSGRVEVKLALEIAARVATGLAAVHNAK